MATEQDSERKYPAKRPNYTLRRLGAGAAVGLALVGGYETVDMVTHIDTVARSGISTIPPEAAVDPDGGISAADLVEQTVCEAVQNAVHNAVSGEALPPAVDPEDLASADSCEGAAAKVLSASGGADNILGKPIRVSVDKNFLAKYAVTVEVLEEANQKKA